MLRISAMLAVLGLLFLVVITSTDAQTLYPVAGQDFSGTDNECTFPCRVETIDGSPLTLTPHLIWAKKRDQDLADTIEDLPDEPFVDLRDPYWYEVELTGFSKDYECRLVELQDKVYYNCDYVEKNCHYVVHSGEYKCILTNLHEDRIYSHVIHYNDPHRDILSGAPCFAATLIASSLTASYNESLGIVVRWDTDVASRPSNQSICNDGLQFDVLVRSYASYEDYIVENVEPEHIFDFATTIRPNGTEFLFPTERVQLNRYYVFVVRNEWRNVAGFYIDQVEVESPLYYFGRQEKPSLSFPEQSTTVIRASLHSTVELRCEGSGVPEPSVNLIHGSLHITSEVPDKTVASKSLVVTTNTVGYYHCVASSTYVAPEGGAEPAFSYKTIVIQLEEAPPVDTELICAPNGNTHCFSVFGDAHVLVNTTDFEFQKRVDDLVVDLDQFLMNNTTAYNTTFLRKVAKCVDHAKALTCSSAFPYCSPDTLLTRPICKNSCQEFAPGGACEGVFDLEQFPGLREIMASNCDTRVHPAGESPECVHVPLEIPPISERSWCVVDDGTSYAGDVFVTSSGTICQDWVSQSPHEHFSSRPELLHQASRDCRNPGGSGERPWCYTIDSSSRWEYCDPPQCTVCEVYKGFTCSHLPGYEGGLVYVNRHESQWDRDGVGRADLWMSSVLLKLELRQSEVPQGCEMGIRELLCHKTLPLCQANSSSPSSLCSEHCKLARLLQVCPQNLLRRLEGEMAETGITFAEPACESSEGEECLPLEMSLVTSVSDGMSTVTVGSEGEIANCYNASDNGHGYQGNVSTTSDGTPCQAWGSDFPDLAKNYCRNPAQVGMRPWCFTDVEGGVWGFCDISECSAIGTIDDFTAGTEEAETDTLSVGFLAVFVVLGLILILVAVIVSGTLIVYRRKRLHRNHHSLDGNSPALLKLRQNREWDYVVNQTYAKVTSPPDKIKEAMAKFPQFSKSSIKYIRQIGQGNFGVVFYAKAEGVNDNEKMTDVAVKTMKEENSTEGLNDFIREAKLMFGFDHENIVKIFGVCVEDLPYYLVFEYMDKGDLALFLRASASSLQRRVMNPFDQRPRSRTESTLSDEPPSLTVEQLTEICKQIAAGMNYLSINNHVHRDLACRNCLVKSCDWNQTASGLIIKIGDFGMSQNLYSSDYYRIRGQAVLPVRWMSPEAIIYGKFSTESDVWSFGVVMWEVFSFAMQPYYGTSNEEVTEFIRRHKVLTKPSDCPNKLYSIMEMCWDMQPKLRPTFEELHNVLSECRFSTSSSTSDPSTDASSQSFYEENSDDDAFYSEDQAEPAAV